MESLHDLTKQRVCRQFTASAIIFLIRERFVEAVIDESSTDIRRISKPLLWIVSHKHKTVSNDLYYKLCYAHYRLVRGSELVRFERKLAVLIYICF